MLKAVRGVFSIILSLILVNSMVNVCYADSCSNAQTALKTAQLGMESAKIMRFLQELHSPLHLAHWQQQ